jgi:hypothetical protein
VSAWQPIESAPKDGTPVIVHAGGNTRVCWFGTCGWTYHQRYGGAATVVLEPTHWMPLPEPPK